MTGKSEGAFRTIGEVAESLDLPQHVLRFWETRFSEIEPVKRAGGRRYYRPRDVELVAAIRRLLYGQGYTIKGVQRLLKEQGVRAVIESARGADPGRRDIQPETPAGASPQSPAPAQETLAFLVAERDEPAAASPAPPPAPTAESKGAGLVALAPRAPSTLTLPAVRLSDTPIRGLDKASASRLREALEELAECKRMLELTRPWRD